MTRYKTKVWADVLQSVMDNYNNMKHSSTGYSPIYLHAGNDERAIEKARQKMEKRNEKWVKQSQAVQANKSRRFCPYQQFGIQKFQKGGKAFRKIIQTKLDQVCLQSGIYQ